MKNKIIISSILTIAMCFSLIAGSTFALFTSESKVDVVVSSATVDVDVDASALTYASTLGTALGSADLTDNVITLTNLVPGDYVTFTLTVTNKSTVSVKYRALVNVVADNGLLSGLVITYDEAFASGWDTLDATTSENGTTVKTVTVRIELPEAASNDYQGKSCKLAYVVEAIQGNATPVTSVATKADLQNAISRGDTDIKLVEDITVDAPIVISAASSTYSLRAAAPVVIDLNGKTIVGTAHKSVGAVLKNEGNLILKNGTISSTANNGGSAIQNNGTVAIENVTLNGAPNADGSWPSYTVNNTGVMTVDNSTITSFHGAVASYNEGAVVTLNNSEIDMAGIPGFTNHGMYTYNNGKIVVNGGTYANKAADQNSTGASVINGNVEINGGTFSGRIENYYGTPKIMGGTFSVSPARFVATGCVANEVEGKWVVSISDLQTVINNAKAGDTIVLNNDVTASSVIMIDKSIVIEGNGHNVASTATRVFRIATSNTEVTLNNVNMVSNAVRVSSNDIRGISIDGSLTNVKLTLNDCSVDFTDASAHDWSYAVNVSGNGTGHTVVVNGGTYEGANVINAHGASNTVVVKDATLNSLYLASEYENMYGAGIWVLQDANSKVEVTGTTFTGVNAVALNVGYTPVVESDNTDNTTRTK